MIGNDSCGVHSVMSGRTSQFVERLTILTYDGDVLEVDPTSAESLSRIRAGGGWPGEIYDGLVALRDLYLADGFACRQQIEMRGRKKSGSPRRTSRQPDVRLISARRSANSRWSASGLAAKPSTSRSKGFSR